MPYHSIHPSTPDGYRRCTKCKEDKPETPEFFKPQKLGHKGLMAACRECTKAYHRQRNAEKPEVRQAARKRYDPQKKKRDAVNDRLRNKQRIKAQQTRWYEANREYSLKKGRENYIADRENRLAKAAEWQRNNPDKVRVRSTRREARKRALPDTFTQADWNRAIEYWHGCCAYCGRQLDDLFGNLTAAADHYIPLASPDCTGTIPTNIVPACDGLGGCNTEKRHTPPEEWVERKFGTKKAKKIIAAIQAYFDYLRSLE